MNVKFLIETDNNNCIATNHGFSIYNAIKKEKWMAGFDDKHYEAEVPEEMQEKFRMLDWFELATLDELFQYRTNKNPDTIIPVGSVEFVRDWVQKIYKKDITKFETFDEKLYESFKFKIGTLYDIDQLPMFVKPYKDIKLFTGEVIEKVKDIQTLGTMYDLKEDVKVLMREPFSSPINAEFRVFVFPKNFLRPYNYETVTYHTNNESNFSIDFEKINAVIRYYTSKFRDTNLDNYYSFDLALLQNQEVKMIEFHDGWALGDYGVDPIRYKNFVKGSWNRILKELKDE